MENTAIQNIHSLLIFKLHRQIKIYLFVFYLTALSMRTWKCTGLNYRTNNK